MAQLGARFHGMEEVVSSNLTRSTKFLKQLQPKPSFEVCPFESNWSPKWTPSRGGQRGAASSIKNHSDH